MSMARTISTLSAGLAAAALLAACSSGYKSGASATSQAAAAGALTTHEVSGVGTVLADSNGMTLYAADEEASGTIKCTGACEQFWKPATATSTSTPSGVMATIGTVTRPNGQAQLTYNGAPLYTFTQDSAPGDAKGNGIKDSFDTNHFTWHAVIITSSGATSSSANTGGGGGY
jgi:predicted lipoprotein with Yx(FWY)xxD motif